MQQNLLEQPSEEINLDEVVNFLKTSVGDLLDLDNQEERYWKEKRQEYEALASDAIARSLKAHGIQPLASKENSPEHNRQRRKEERDKLKANEFRPNDMVE